MSTAILANETKTGEVVKFSLPDYKTNIYTEIADIEECKVVVVSHNFHEKGFKIAIDQLKEKKKKIFCIIQEHERLKWGPYLENKKIPFVVNGIDTTDTLQQFMKDEGTDNLKQQRKSFVFISADGGVGKSFLSSYLAKTLSDDGDRKVRFVDWNHTSPSIHHYFGLSPKDADIVQVLKLMRSGLPYDIGSSEVKVGKNLSLSLMSLDYFESIKWRAEDFTILWDHYEQQPEETVIYEVPNHPFSITSAVALMRGTDIVIPLVTEQNSISHTLMLLRWIKSNRERNMPKIYLVLNRYSQEISNMTVQDIEKTLGYDIIATIPNIKDAWNDFISGELFKDKMTKEMIKKVEPLRKYTEALGFHVKEIDSEKKSVGLIRKVIDKVHKLIASVSEGVKQNVGSSIRRIKPVDQTKQD